MKLYPDSNNPVFCLISEIIEPAVQGVLDKLLQTTADGQPIDQPNGVNLTKAEVRQLKQSVKAHIQFMYDSGSEDDTDAKEILENFLDELENGTQI